MPTIANDTQRSQASSQGIEPRRAKGTSDEAVLRSVAGPLAGEDPAFLAQLAAIATAESERRLAEIRAGLDALDADATRRAAHSLKGALLSFGRCQAADIAAAIEALCREGRLDEARLGLDRLAPACERFLRRMDCLRLDRRECLRLDRLGRMEHLRRDRMERQRLDRMERQRLDRMEHQRLDRMEHLGLDPATSGLAVRSRSELLRHGLVGQEAGSTP